MTDTIIPTDETVQHENDFVYGENERNGCTCPAVAAEISPAENRDAEKMAVTYDNVIREKAAHSFGFVDEETARKAWLEALQNLRDGLPTYQNTSGPIEVGEAVVEQLGWDDE
jgi:hypothetical protein